MEFSSLPTNPRKSLWTQLAEKRVILRLQTFWRWLTLIRSDDPVRRVLNRGFATVLIILCTLVFLLMPALLLGGELSAFLIAVVWGLVSLLMGWLNRRGTIYGAVLFTILFVVAVPLALPPANYVGSEADSSLSLLLAIPIMAATLFIRPWAGLVALIFQVAVTAIAIGTSTARQDLATAFVFNLT